MLAFPPDVTFLIQLVSFFVLLFFLHRLLFAPFSELLTAREQRTLGARERAAKDQAEAEALARTITRGLEEARAVALSEAASIRRGTREREGEIFNEAKRAAAAKLAELRASIGQERDRAKKSLRDDAAGLAHSMVEAVLRRDDTSEAR